MSFYARYQSLCEECGLSPQSRELLVDAFRLADEDGRQEIICVCRNEMHKAEDRLARQKESV